MPPAPALAEPISASRIAYSAVSVPTREPPCAVQPAAKVPTPVSASPASAIASSVSVPTQKPQVCAVQPAAAVPPVPPVAQPRTVSASPANSSANTYSISTPTSTAEQSEFNESPSVGLAAMMAFARESHSRPTAMDASRSLGLWLPTPDLLALISNHADNMQRCETEDGGISHPLLSNPAANNSLIFRPTFVRY